VDKKANKVKEAATKIENLRERLAQQKRERDKDFNKREQKVSYLLCTDVLRYTQYFLARLGNWS